MSLCAVEVQIIKDNATGKSKGYGYSATSAPSYSVSVYGCNITSPYLPMLPKLRLHQVRRSCRCREGAEARPGPVVLVVTRCAFGRCRTMDGADICGRRCHPLTVHLRSGCSGMQQCLHMDPVLQGKLDRAGGGKSHGGGQNMPDAQCTV